MPKGIGEDKIKACVACGGEGYIGTLGAFTHGDIDEWYDSPEDYLSAHEASKERCACCKGKRVCTKAEQAAYREECEYQRERLAEMPATYRW